MGKFGVPMNPDAYDGYAAEREKVLLRRPGACHLRLGSVLHGEVGRASALHMDKPRLLPSPPCRATSVQLLEAFSLAGSNPVVLAGDSHNAWCHEILDSNGNRQGGSWQLQGALLAMATTVKQHHPQDKCSALRRERQRRFCPWCIARLLKCRGLCSLLQAWRGV